MRGDSAAFSGSIPQHYEEILVPMLFADYAADLAERAAASSPNRILELAAGTGAVTRRLRDRLPASAHLTATDVQEPMLALARAKFKAGELVETQRVDATDLPYADASFDAVVCQFGVMFFPDKDRSYREVYRVLESGGRYLFNVWDAHAHNAFARITHTVIGDAFIEDPPQFMRIPFSYPFDPIKDSLVAAGFTGITATVVSKQKDVPNPEAFARGLIYGSPIVDQLRNRGLVDPEHLVDALVRQFRAQFGDPGRMSLQALVISADKP